MGSYASKVKIDNYDEPSTSFIDVGIHEPIKLTNIRFGQGSKTGNKYLAFDLLQIENNRTLSHTEYEPDDPDLEKLEGKIANQIKRIGHILTKFMSKEDYNKIVESSNSFEEFANNIINKFNSVNKDIDLRVKVVYGNKNFTSLPKYVPFIEKVSEVPKEKSKLEMTTLDRTEKINFTSSPTEKNPYVIEESTPQVDSSKKEAEEVPF